MKIIIETIPHDQQRYPTVGDYFTAKDLTEHVKVSAMSDWRYELLVAVHELIEDYICKHRSIPEAAITDFDISFEAERMQGKHQDEAEPGDDPRAPYYEAHQFATIIEKLLAKELGVNWLRYDEEVVNL